MTMRSGVAAYGGAHWLNRLIARSMPSREPALDGLGHGIEQLVERSAAPRGVNGAEHEVGELVEPGGHGPDADPEPGVVLPLERALDALEAVVPAGRARAAQPEPAQRQGDVVHQNQQVAAGIEVRKATERRESRAAPVHVGLRLEQATGRPVPASLAPPGPARRGEGAEPPARGQVVGQSKPGVVPGLVVLRAGVAQPHDGAQGSGLRFGSRPRPRPSASG